MIRFRIPRESMGLGLAALMVADLSVTAQAAPRFLLITETWTHLAAGGAPGTGTFTAHTYDADARRVRTEIFIGKDGSGERTERRELAYFPDGLLETQTHWLGDDLDSRVTHRYDAKHRLETKGVSGPDGVERFRDAFAYDGSDRVTSETRWKGDAVTFMRRNLWNPDGGPSGDTLLEASGTALIAVQATAHGAGRAEGERRESRFRKQDGVWYHVEDTFRMFTGTRLLHTVVYPVGGRRSDSLAYAYDAEGNRILEERFNGDGRPLSRLTLAYRDLLASSIRPLARRDAGRVRLPALVLSGRDGSGWRHADSDLLGRGRTPTLNLLKPLGAD
jgi:hypothetical protein